MSHFADPQNLLDHLPMTRLQVVAVFMCVLLNALDGFDVLAISFASPGIAADWGVDRAALGLVLSMELIGMAFGSVILGNVADRLGRYPVLLGCLMLMTVAMFVAATAKDVLSLSVVRFITGLGIGGLMATTNAMVAEFANAKRRHMCVVLMAAGYPLGAIIGGSVVSVLLVHFDWRAVFVLGGLVTGILIPLVWLFLPESIAFLVQKRPPDALRKINNVLTRMGYDTVHQLPELVSHQARAGIGELLSPALRRTTLLLTVAYFTHIMTFYFILKWIPKIVVDMGFVASSAGTVLVWANVGGILGSLLFSLLTQKYDVYKLVVGALLMAFVMVVVFGHASANLQQLSLFAAMAGFFTNSAVVGLYALFAQSFPTSVRAGGTGFVIGMGRGGAALGPVVAGFLFAGGYSLAFVAFFMALGSLVALVAILLKMRVRLVETPSILPAN
ncbi:MFS transporter [Halioxenophilus sp. WMMB6]|uniref:MFS transporter n=1 Tax=Halioxenophilus sp. WMMB6 TaxID=3073815 RepID=UPI00295EACC5|nr:MFS transporter [Halioxenophilus sp. WMMB6]